ncbi:MAG: AAA family ATPase [Bacteroidota bacterium]
MKLPIGIQTFGEIRTEGYLYVDKTAHIHRMIHSGKYFFLARPRRFGKSLLLSTMEALYRGQRALFEGLWIADHWDWSQQYPILHLQFSKLDYQSKGLEAAIVEELQAIAADRGVFLKKDSAKSSFLALIKALSKEAKLVILIDEYDKPIIDYLEELEQAKANRQVFKTFYSVLKDSDPYLKLVFITGVSRFAKTSIFSDLNNLINLSMHPLAANLLGITLQEMEAYFSEKIQFIADQKKISIQLLKQQIKDWYDGYSWDAQQYVYNPFSLLSFFLAERFDNFWFETGTPTFLVNLMRKNYQYRIEDMMASDLALSGYSLEQLNPTTILFQTGYLTIKEQPANGVYLLDYPNK